MPTWEEIVAANRALGVPNPASVTGFDPPVPAVTAQPAAVTVAARAARPEVAPAAPIEPWRVRTNRANEEVRRNEELNQIVRDAEAAQTPEKRAEIDAFKREFVPGSGPAKAASAAEAAGATPADDAAPGPPAASAPVQYAPTVVSPAHWDTTRIPHTGELQQARIANIGEQGQAAQQIMREQATGQVLQADAMDLAAREAEERMATRNAERELEQRQRDEIMRKRDEVSAQIQKMDVDGNRLMRSPGGMLMAIGAIFRQGNSGFDLLERAIDRDIAEQKGKIDRKRQQVGDLDTIYAHYRQAGMDKDAAEHATRAEMYRVASQKAQAIAQRSGSATMMAQAADLQKQTEGRQLDAIARYQEASYVPRQVFGGGPIAGEKVDPTLAVHMPDGSVRVAPDKEARMKAQTAVVFATQMKQINTEILDARKKRSEAFDAGDYATAQSWDNQLEALRERRINALSSKEGQGVTRDPEYIRAAKILNPAKVEINPLTKGHTNKFLEQESARMDRILENEVRTWAPEVATHGYARTASGGVAPLNRYAGEALAPPKYVKPKSFVSATGEKNDEKDVPKIVTPSVGVVERSKNTAAAVAALKGQKAGATPKIGMPEPLKAPVRGR